MHALPVTARNRHEAAVQQLLESNAEVDAWDGRAVLHYAAGDGDEAAVGLLLENGQWST